MYRSFSRHGIGQVSGPLSSPKWESLTVIEVLLLLLKRANLVLVGLSGVENPHVIEHGRCELSRHLSEKGYISRPHV